MLLRAVRPREPRLELPEQHVVHQGRLAGPRHTRHRGEGAQWNARVDVPEVVQAGAFHLEPAPRRAGRRRHPDKLLSRQVTGSEERRGGEEWRSRWSAYHSKKKN